MISWLKNNYERTVVKKTGKNSIERQNLIYQVHEDKIGLFVEEEYPKCRKPDINGKTEKRAVNAKAEKLGLKQFLLEFASLNKNERTESLLKLRKLVVLYFYGLDAVVKIGNDPFANHVEYKNNTELFAPIIYEKIQKTGGVENKNVISQIDTKEWVKKVNAKRYLAAKKVTDEDNQKQFFDSNEAVDINMYWLHHISKAVTRLLIKGKIPWYVADEEYKKEDKSILLNELKDLGNEKITWGNLKDPGEPFRGIPKGWISEKSYCS